MAQQVFYQTLNMVGVDPTTYYTNLATAGGSVTPEYPAPPFIAGTRAFGSDGSEFVFVQASTSISLTDFVILNSAQQAGTYQANSVTNTTVISSLGVAIAATGLIVKQSVSFIPAGAFFWAQTKGQFIPATTSTGLASNAGGVTLFSTATAGVLSSVTTSSTLAGAFIGIICINSLTVSIPASIVPPTGGTQSSTGFTVGPVVNMNNPRPYVIVTSVTLATGSLNVWW